MNLKAAAQRLGVHYQTAYRWVREGRLPAVRVGGRYDIDEETIAAFLAGGHEPGDGGERPPVDFDEGVLSELEHFATTPAETPYQAVLAAARVVAHHVGDVGAVHRVTPSGSVDLVAIDTHIPALRARLVDIASEMELESFGMDDDGTSELLIEHLDQARFDRSLSPRARLLLDGVRVRSAARVPVEAHGDHRAALVSFRVDELAHTVDDLARLAVIAGHLGAAILAAPPEAFGRLPVLTG